MIRKRTIVMGVACLIISASVSRVCGALAQSGPPQITVTASFQEQQVAPDEQIELVLSRAIEPQEGRIAIFIGRQDVTALFSAAGDRLRYDPKLVPLPVGESEVIVYSVSAGNEWREIARFTLRVQAPQQAEAADESTENTVAASDDQTQPAQKRLGFEKLDAIPSITLNIKSQPAQSSFPDSNRPERPTFTDLTMQGSFRTEMARGLFNSQMQFDFVGSSFQNEALRFGDLGDRAPQIDLASYLMQFQTGRVKYQVGHFSFGTLRHLMNHSSRGVMLSLSAGPRADFSATVLNGSSIVGYDNFFGIAKRRHQLVSATLGFEFLPKRPGGLRVEVGALEGWLQPVSGFNQGAVNDAERSRGAGIRLLASDPSGRFRVESGFTRSQFFNPPDPLLDQGSGAIQVPPVTRNARYIDASFEVLKDLALFKDRRASLTVGFKHETVDPLYRSLGASTQADKAQNEVSLTGAIGDITAQFSHLRFNDNLADIPSILKSLTRANTFAASIPLASVFGDPAKPSPLLPRLSYNLSRTLQFGAAIPVRGGFEIDLSSIPDQLGTVQGITADWQIAQWRLGYRVNHSFQNNRQTGRELADFANLTNGFVFGVTPSDSIDINLDINLESAENKEAGTLDRTFRLAPSINWRISPKSTFAGSLSTTFAGDAADTKRNRNVEFDVQWTYQFGLEKGRLRNLQGQFFIRFASLYSSARDRLFGLDSLTRSQTLNMGLSFSFS